MPGKAVCMASCDWPAQPCEIPTSIQELVLLSGWTVEIAHGVKCLPSPLLSLGPPAAPTFPLALPRDAPFLLFLSSFPPAQHILSWDLLGDGGEMVAREENGEEERDLGILGQNGDKKILS